MFSEYETAPTYLILDTCFVESIEGMATVEVGDDNDAHECPVCLDDLRKTVAVMGEVKEMPGSMGTASRSC
ncbi:putative protein ASPARTIC PROTEASE IN GUARD CELL 1 [Iris pallida]|uniref:Uncharacterized protein n=1 Tax=Iris pallida TaxID=29817 RepID=A0AAX6GNZ6_IRIPA|nr:putative protein ASPARTIC PROTEASE IN GUARD CELL 1 [Iris pallida]